MGTTHSDTHYSSSEHFNIKYRYNDDDINTNTDAHVNDLVSPPSPLRTMSASPSISSSSSSRRLPLTCYSSASSSSHSSLSSTANNYSSHAKLIAQNKRINMQVKSQSEEEMHQLRAVTRKKPNSTSLSSPPAERTLEFFVGACCSNKTLNLANDDVNYYNQNGDNTNNNHNEHDHTAAFPGSTKLQPRRCKTTQQLYEQHSHQQDFPNQELKEGYEITRTKYNNCDFLRFVSGDGDDSVNDDCQTNRRRTNRLKINFNCNGQQCNDMQYGSDEEYHDLDTSTDYKHCNRVNVPLHNFDLDVVHPVKPPFLGISYWEEEQQKEEEHERQSRQRQQQQQQQQQQCDGAELILDGIQYQHHIHHNHNQQQNDSGGIDEAFDDLNISNITHGPSSPSTPKRRIDLQWQSQPQSHIYPRQRYDKDQLALLASPSVLLSNADAYSTPNIKCGQNQQLDYDYDDGYSLRTTESNFNRMPRTPCSSGTSTSGGGNSTGNNKQKQKNKVFVTFTPKRLFGNDDDKETATFPPERKDFNNCQVLSGDIVQKGSRDGEEMEIEYNHPRSQRNQYDDRDCDSYSSGSTNIMNPTSLFLSTPKPSRCNNYSNSICHHGRSQSDDTSIILRNGILTKSPVLDSGVARSPAISPCRSVSTQKSHKTYFSTQTRDIPDGGKRKDRQSGALSRHINTLPSFRSGVPIRLKVTESYAGFSSGFVNHGSTEQEIQDFDNGNGKHDSDGTCSDPDAGAAAVNTSNISMLSDLEQTNFFSYDPYFSLGEYLISKSNNLDYGNGLSVKMGEQYMTLQDKDGRVYGVTRSRHTFIPSSVIYSSKARFEGQTPSSHRPNINNHHYHQQDDDDDGVELYPWALAKKEGRRMDHDVSIHLVAEPNERKNGVKMVGGLFHKNPSFVSRHGFDSKGGHSHTVVYRINDDEEYEKGSENHFTPGDLGSKENTNNKEIPCCIMLRDPIHRDVFDVTIAPGIDPLLIVCTMAVHFKMVSVFSF